MNVLLAFSNPYSRSRSAGGGGPQTPRTEAALPEVEARRHPGLKPLCCAGLASRTLGHQSHTSAAPGHRGRRRDGPEERRPPAGARRCEEGLRRGEGAVPGQLEERERSRSAGGEGAVPGQLEELHRWEEGAVPGQLEEVHRGSPGDSSGEQVAPGEPGAGLGGSSIGR